MMFDVLITPSAKADIFETHNWFLLNFPEFAETWLMIISEAIT